MLESVKNFFSEHARLLKERTDLEAKFKSDQAELSAELECVRNKPLRSLAEIDAARAELAAVQKRREKSVAAYQKARDNLDGEIILAAPPAIDEAVRRLQQERDHTTSRLSVRAYNERSASGRNIGMVETNRNKILARLEAIDGAMRQLRALKSQPITDVKKQIAAIEGAVPPLDTAVETLETSPLFAGSVIERNA
jgi:predicted  nucleic acid-binding Zn-ribbon protein